MKAPFTAEQVEQVRASAVGLLFVARFHPGDWPMVRWNVAPGTTWLVIAAKENIDGRPAERMYLFSSAPPRLVVSEMLTTEEARARLEDLLTRATLIQTSR